MTDLQQSGWDAADSGVRANVSVVIEEIEGPAANVAVTAVRPDGDGAVAVVQSYSSSAVTEQVVFTVDGRRLDAVAVTLSPGGNAEACHDLAHSNPACCRRRSTTAKASTPTMCATQSSTRRARSRL